MKLKLVSCEWDFKEIKKIGEIIKEPLFEDVVFSDKQKEFIKLAITKLKAGHKLNLLFSGLAGTGKTYSAKMIACETQKPFVYITGSLGRRKIIDMLLDLKPNALILIDEIHNLSERVSEIIYPAIEYNELYLNGNRKIIDAVFIGTTTEPEKLPKPLLDRFMRIEFEEPDINMTTQILKKMGLTDECINLMTNYTLNIRILKKIIDYMKLYGGLNKENLIKVFRMMKINVYSGLSEEQEAYIDYLKEVKRAGLRNLSLVLRRSENYLKLDIEPDLIRKRMILISSRGRELNPEFLDFSYENLKKEEEKNHSNYSINEREIAIKYLNDNPHLKEKFGNKYLELVDFLAEKIAVGISPDTIDIESWGNDIGFKESYKNNYLEEL
ncbi:MAG: AAA family ATPase [Candidatus Helarchaeota archaeon]